MTGVDLRHLSVEDEDRWYRLQRESMPDPLDLQGLQREWGQPRSLKVGAFHLQELVGVFLGWIVVDELQVIQVCTAAQARGQGVASALMREALRYAVAQGVTRTVLEVRRSNAAARALYQRLGFKVDGVRPRFYSGGEDAVLMSHEGRCFAGGDG